MNPETNDTAITTLIDLVSTPSVSGDEAGAIGVFTAAAQRLGLPATTDEAGNGIALRGAIAEETHRVVLLGHIDTVPGDSPIGVHHGALYGRGAVDAKGPLAAFLFAAAQAQLPDGVALEVIAAVGEETADSPGATYVRERRNPAACIIGEPSGWDGVTIGYKGRLLVEARCKRDWSHTAGAEQSAADTLHDWWTSVLHSIGGMQPPGDKLFEQVQATIQSSSAGNDGLRETAQMTGGFRLPISCAPEELESVIRGLTPECVSLTFTGHTPAHTAGRSNPVARALSGAIRAEGGTPRPKNKTGTADFNVVGPAWDCPIAAYGPGDSSLDHTPNEHIILDEYLRSIRVLRGAIEALSEELVVQAATIAG